MATIKSYTDLEQSQALAEILPLESADNYWFRNDTETPKIYQKDMMKDSVCVNSPCWSLAALLGVLPNENMLVKTTDGEYYCLAKDVMTEHYDNPIDACYVMIIYLHELKKL